eukprot:GILJ01019681.1.p1 GENE.GILJ01019681.1~~GILJ01019681.1.p1  ORF type:complete len:716 (+),score=142.84 GILJ01019681.1:220-2148(+)
MVIANGRPNLTSSIAAVVLSPSRVLAEQTAVVAKKLCARYPFNVSAVLCDEVVEPPKAVLKHLRKAKRGAGMILITTPEDLTRLLDYIENPEEEEGNGDTEDTTGPTKVGTKRSRDGPSSVKDIFGTVDYIPAYMPHKGGPLGARKETADDAEEESAKPVEKKKGPSAASLVPQHLPFVFVVDEADVVLKAARMRSQVESFTRRLQQDTTTGLDVGLYGATVGSSDDAESFAKFAIGQSPAAEKASPTKGKKAAAKAVTKQASTLERVVLHSNEDFVSLLLNRYIACPVQDYLHTLVHTINLHPNRKHFIFFNSMEVLLFVKGVLEQLVVKAEGDGVGRGKHHTVAKNGQRTSMLYISKIYAMHEQLTEVAKFNEYNGFLSHGGGGEHSAAGGGFTKAKIVAHKRDLLIAKEGKGPDHHQTQASKEAKDPEGQKNPHFMGGWKRDSRPTPGQGAILLCTDEAAFGLDVRDVDYVYHAELPSTPQAYVHRIGRVGRMGMRGTSVLLLPVELPEDQAPQSDAATWTASGSFRTIKNSKSVSKGHPTATVTNSENGVTEEHFSEEQKKFFDSLNAARSLERYRLPGVAPLTPSIRAVVQDDPKLLAMGKGAAMRLSGFQQEKVEGAYLWWTPRMALQGLLLATAK